VGTTPPPRSPRRVPLLRGHREDAALRCEWCDAVVRVDTRGRCRNCGAPAPSLGLVIEPGLVLEIPPRTSIAPATMVSADWLANVQNELCRTIEGAGLPTRPQPEELPE
jgi:hypothetical protein